jgi:phosphatidylinositol alpha-1,6-mannosyltransferase
MQPFRRVLLISPEFGVVEDGTYRPSGVAQFSRCVMTALASASQIDTLSGWGLLDAQSGVDWFGRRYVEPMQRSREVKLRGFGGDRKRMGAFFLAVHRRYDIVMFLHMGVSRLSVLRPMGRSVLWLVGLDVRRRLGWRERFAVRKASPLLSISRFSNDQMLHYNPTLPSATTVHLCVEPDQAWLNPDRKTPTSAGYEARSREPAVLIVARQSASQRYKGHEQLILGWNRVLAKMPDAELWIVGTGTDRARLERLAREGGPDVERRVRFFGEVGHEKLLKLYATARVFAMPSTGEGFGLVFAEAMRQGLPCICSRDAAAEIVVHEETGLVVDQTPDAISEACIRLLSDVDLADRMSNAGRLRFKNEFTFDAMRARLFQALNLSS